ncbi:MAG: hypothetical protein JWP91_1404 [Fibrobacteres bacterium]|nr:hypothetical protein [Fibrobacterota bacterium]
MNYGIKESGPAGGGWMNAGGRMHAWARGFKRLGFGGVALGFAANWAAAAIPDGPGLTNKTWTAAQVGKPVALIKSREGHGSVAMHRGYLVVIFSKDSGLGAGGYSFMDISDPAHPKVVHTEDTPETQNIREPHGWGMRGDVACVQANEGMQFWDWSDVTSPKLLAYLKLPDIQVSDYDKGMWWTCWQGGYVYGGGSGNGLYIVDAKDPSKPVFIKKLPTSATGGFRVGPTFAIGNLLVLSSTDTPGFSTLDIGDPVNPRLLATVKAGISYSAMVNGNRILASGSEADLGKLLVYDISDPSKIVSMGATAAMGDKGGYNMFSDGYAFSGFSHAGFAKFDLSKPGFPVAQRGTSGVDGADEDFCTALGNIAFASSDHSGGSSLIPHQTGPDTSGPRVNMAVPKDGAVKQPLTTRVGLTFTDLLDKATLTSANLIVRPVGGQAIPGAIATQTGIVNFSPASPLLPNTTYEVIVNEGGIKDYAGNGVPKAYRGLFSTGAAITTGIGAEHRNAKADAPAYAYLNTLPPGLASRYGGKENGAGRFRVDVRGRFLPLFNTAEALRE